jgi:hypothetical protein
MLVAAVVASAAEKPPSLISNVHVLDETASRCLSCPSEAIPARIRVVVDTADPAVYGAWLQEHFSSRHAPFDSIFKDCGPLDVGLHFHMDQPHGMWFRGSGYRIFYEVSTCFIPDCSRRRMWRVDDSGSRRWKRKVPFARVPVQPFVIGDLVLYIGAENGRDVLVMLDVRSGRTLETISPQGTISGHERLAGPLSPAFYTDGFIYLEGATKYPVDPETKLPTKEVPGRKYVLEVAF